MALELCLKGVCRGRESESILHTKQMSLITIIWSMIASACLTLAAINFLIWGRNREAWANLFFSLVATGTAAWTFCELWMMRAETLAEFPPINVALCGHKGHRETSTGGSLPHLWR
jgi:hypothetical protein